MSDIKLGETIRGIQQRDAIHVAVAPVVAAETLQPGQHIGFTELGNTVRVGTQARLIGIVDPFLKRPVGAGEQFYMLLYQNTVTGMRHEWAHPDFKPVMPQDADAEKWLREFATEVDMTLDRLLDAAWDYIKNDEDYCLSFDTPDLVWESRSDFWKHFEAYTGEKVSGRHKDSMFFRCAC